MTVFGFSFEPVFWLSGRPSPNWTHWRDGPTHQEWPQDKVRPWGRPYPRRNLPQLVKEETDHLLELPGWDQQLRKPGDLGGRVVSWMITSLGLPGREQQLRKPRDSGEGRHNDYKFLGAPRKGATVKETWGLRREALWQPLNDCECMHDCWLNWVREIFLFGNYKTKSFCICNQKQLAYAIKNN